MNSLFLVRGLFALVALIFLSTHAGSASQFAYGIGIALLAGGLDLFVRRLNLRVFTLTTIGLFFGYLLGNALIFLFSSFSEISLIVMAPELISFIKAAFLFFGSYLGIVMTLKSCDEFHLSIPFVRFTSLSQKKKDLIMDASILADGRIIDLASSGLIDQQLVLPRFLLKDLSCQAESLDEMVRNRAKRALEVVKKLEQIPHLEMRVNESDFPEIKDPMNKLVHIARILDGMILTADFTRLQISAIEDVRVINIHALSNALKPLTQTGERIKIKIQRLGKEARQGVGYLEDGTMVVVNGGGEFIGEAIEGVVLSVKHTTSGRMIFCNALEEQNNYQPVYEDAAR